MIWSQGGRKEIMNGTWKVKWNLNQLIQFQDTASLDWAWLLRRRRCWRGGRLPGRRDIHTGVAAKEGTLADAA